MLGAWGFGSYVYFAENVSLLVGPVFFLGKDTVTTPLLLRLVQVGKLRPAGLVTPRFGLDDIMQAYDTFADAAKTSALRVILKGRGAD